MFDNNEKVLIIDKLFKEYKLGVISHGTLYRDLQSLWARILRRDDPNSIINDYHNLESEKTSFLALKNISFDVNRGEIIGIIGKNGAGKSTILKILSRITSPTKGKINIKGRIGSLLEVGTGFHPELTGRENIYLNGSILGMTKKEIAEKIEQIIEFAGIGRHIDTPVKRYSSGMSVRLAFSVAAHLDPEILIVDEVLAVGDVEFQKKCLGKMKDISKGQGRTVIFVSHNMGAIKNLCTRVIVLKKGQIVYNGETEKAISYYLNENQNENEYEINVEKSDRRNSEYNPYIKNIGLKNRLDIKTNEFTQGEDVKLQIEYSVPDNIKVDTAGFSILSAEGIVIGGVNTFMTLKPPHSLPNKASIVFFIPKKTLIPGKYYLNVSIGNKVKMLDKLEEVISFFVTSEDIYKTGYLLSKDDGLISLNNVKTEVYEK